MGPNWPITTEPEETSFAIQTIDLEHHTYPFAHPAKPRRGWLKRALAKVAAYLVEGFALCAAGTYPELFHGTEQRPHRNPDELADDAPRSWRSDVDAELQAIVAKHRSRR